MWSNDISMRTHPLACLLSSLLSMGLLFSLLSTIMYLLYQGKYWMWREEQFFDWNHCTVSDEEERTDGSTPGSQNLVQSRAVSLLGARVNINICGLRDESNGRFTMMTLNWNSRWPHKRSSVVNFTHRLTNEVKRFTEAFVIRQNVRRPIFCVTYWISVKIDDLMSGNATQGLLWILKN